MDYPNITMEEYIRLEKEKAQKHDKVFNWETAKYGKIWYDEDIHNLRSVETEFPAIAFNNGVSSEKHFLVNPRFMFMEGYGNNMVEVGDCILRMKGLGVENADVPQRRMVSRVFENPILGSDSNTSINDQIAAIMEIHDIETLFGVKFTSQSDIDVFSMSIKEGKYADILSTMSTADIDAIVNAIETIGKKFQDEVNKAAGA
nr:hypothetical protein [Tanacetum cinerariifolium]